MTARPCPPSTSTTTTPHPRDDLLRFVNKLNVRYNIGVSIPDPTLTPAEKREDQSPANRIYRRLEIHFFTGGIHALNAFLGEFDKKAKQFWSNWVHKPKADADTLPRTHVPPLAANLNEREYMQTIFNQILDTAQPVMQSSRSFSRTQSGPASVGGQPTPDKTSTPNSQSPPKRRADAELTDFAKKPKPEADYVDPIEELTASSSLRRRPPAHILASASASSVMGPPTRTTHVNSTMHKSFATTSSRSTGLSTSAVFSEAGTAPVWTQDTNVASSQEQARPPLTGSPSSCSQDSYGVTSSLEASLHRSFNQQQLTSKRPSTRSVAEESVISMQSSDVFSSMPPEVEEEAARYVSNLEAQSKQCLPDIWPLFPTWLRDVPFPIAWEVSRIAQSCGVDLTTINNLVYSTEWKQQMTLRTSLMRHPDFQGKTFPVASSDVAWAAGLRAAGLQDSAIIPVDQVVYTASLEFGSSLSHPLQLIMRPLKVEQGHRLARQFGADRFLELLVPSPDSSNLPAKLKKEDASFFEMLISWLHERQKFCGRTWAAFYTKAGGSRAPVKDLHIGPPPKPVYQDRIYFFAEDTAGKTRVRLSNMLRWGLELSRKANQKQPVLKLFQRIALLLSRTSPVMVFQPSQIICQEQDLLSPKDVVMNDGVGRMSPAVARHIRDALGLAFTPSAVQGRLGSAKGMWIIDTRIPPSSDEIMIETYPSQRKWELDWSKADENHRTLEIRNFASLPKSASFNLQFLPVLEDRATNKTTMRKAIGNLLETNLKNELDGQKRALQTPLQYRQWVHENATHKHDRIIHGHVPFQGGLPQEDEEAMNMMLDAGFLPKQNKFLNKITYEMQKRKCEMLMKKLNITVGRSAYLYMVIDFLGILEENEVHIGFSTAFEADDDWSETMIHGTDILVARSPSHFVHDIQRVQAVFRPELAALKDVVVFSSKGDIPLAEKLSGGDYDGDLAWCCWDPRIVDNFQNAPVQDQPDLSHFMPKDKQTLHDLIQTQQKPSSWTPVVDAMLTKSFEFNLTKSMLGPCTNYKERFCYQQNSVSGEVPVYLSTLLSNLVDQAKQGMRFNQEDWVRLRRELKLPAHIGEPAYKQDHWRGEPPTHIIDYLKFSVAKPTVAAELKSFHEALNDNATGGSHDWDEDVASYYKSYEEQAEGKFESSLLKSLKEDIDEVHKKWKAHTGDDGMSFPAKVDLVYSKWQEIQPHEELLGGSRTSSRMARRLHFGGQQSNWELLKASTAFWMYCNSGNAKKYGRDARFVWQMACLQLCWIKAAVVTARSSAAGGLGAGAAPRAVVPEMYAALRPDAKFVKQVTARMEGGSQFGLRDSEDEDLDEYD